MGIGLDVRHLVGYEVHAPGGVLGVVVDPEGDDRLRTPATIVVQGGVSRSLYYHLPAELVSSVSPGRRSLAVEVTSGDFSPRLRDDGSVDLYVR